MKSIDLFPCPRRLEFLSPRSDSPLHPDAVDYVRVEVDTAAVKEPQGYHIEIDHEIHAVAHDSAGAYYAMQTLRQVAAQCDVFLPRLRINDHPDFLVRGVVLDISRDRVPTMACLYQLVDLLASWRINHLQLYTEHTFAYHGHEIVWRHASPIIPQEVRQFDAYCRDRCIELVPNQNSFGHLERWLKHDRYAPLAECRNGWDAPWGEHYDFPHTLCPLDPRCLDLLTDLYDQLLPNFQSRLFNVGCDETWEIGQGRSASAVESDGVGRVYLDYLHQVHELVLDRGHTMLYYGDMIHRGPQLASELPRERAIAIEWGYEANHDFDENCGRLKQADIPFYVCPGTSSWNSLTGRTDNALANLDRAAKHGLNHGAEGYLIAAWGDYGHLEPLPVAYLGWAIGAGLSWNYTEHRRADVRKILDDHIFNDQAAVMGKTVYDLGNTYLCFPAIFNASPLSEILRRFNAPLDGELLGKLKPEHADEALVRLEAGAMALPASRMRRPDANLVVAELQWAAGLSSHAARLIRARLDASAARVADLDTLVKRSLAHELQPLIDQYADLWRARSRPGGFVSSVRQLKNLLETYGAS